jgi:hypothetical protein|tara:strand:+ start:8 stop:514 length:507 start_codon:yes stop_codon:yes gene_type:complete
MEYLNKFKEYLNEMDDEIEKEIDEMSVTGGLDGGEGPVKTPKAFSDGSKKSKKKQKDNATASTGYDVVNDSTYMKMMKSFNSTGRLNETSYQDYKKDLTASPQQKVNRGIAEVNKMLGLMEKIVNNNLRLKTEMGVQSNHFWKSTGNRFAKINERMTRIAHRLKELSS